ncbi:MAG: hypothetical protein J5674_04525 [Candidatus Methanomethylophilaceae archaeon]|nr:hypothetical protein [Candidatus Methanomethylophilaceae archaeon]
MEMRRYVSKGGGPTIVIASMKGSGETIASRVIDVTCDIPLTLLVFESDSWFDDFSPWPSEAGGRSFGGLGRESLEEIEEAAPEGSLIAGYSLAGLFALWALYSSDVFTGAACCSGSLWYEGWDKFVESRAVPPESSVYLSLGGKESGSGRPPMSTIGECYLRQEMLLKQDPGVSRMIYVKERGGHFTDPDGRLARGIIWLAENGRTDG